MSPTEAMARRASTPPHRLSLGVVAASIGAALLLAPTPARADDDWLGPDKALHFGASALVAGGGYALGAAAFEGYGPRLALGVGLGLAAGLTKELLDAAGLGDPSAKDLVWDVAGVAVGVGLAFSIDFAVRGPSRPAPAPAPSR